MIAGGSFYSFPYLWPHDPRVSGAPPRQETPAWVELMRLIAGEADHEVEAPEDESESEGEEETQGRADGDAREDQDEDEDGDGEPLPSPSKKRKEAPRRSPRLSAAKTSSKRRRGTRG